MRQQADLALAYFALVALVGGLAAVGLGVVARPLYMLGGVVLAWYTLRRSPWLYLSATLWFWLMTAFVRRLIEWRAGFNPTDVILATPNLMGLFMLLPILTAPGLLARREVGPGLAVAGAVTYGLCVSFFRGDVMPGAVAAADWLAPLFYFFFVVAHRDKADTLEPHFRAFVLLGLCVTVPYGLVQYFFLPEWDAKWMVASEMRSIGRPLPLEVRVFGTTNNPGFLACWLGVCVMLAPFLRGRMLTVLAPAAAFVLLLTLVRSIYGAVAVALLASLLLGRGHIIKPLSVLALVMAVLCASLAVMDPAASDKIVMRLQSVQDLEGDDSAQVRKVIYEQTPAIIDGQPFGLGIGAMGRGAAATGNEDMVAVDSGPLASYLALGWVGGSVYILGLVFAAGQALAAARRHPSPLVLAFACAALCPLATFPFVNVIGFNGTLMWICLGCAAVLGGHTAGQVGSRHGRRRDPPRAVPRPPGPASRNDPVTRPSPPRSGDPPTTEASKHPRPRRMPL